ncbi:hypothetical protein [Endothiovibrio diazotrophicus]
MSIKTVISALVLAGLLGAGLALPATAAADRGWRDRGRDHHALRDWRHDHRYDQYDNGRYRNHWAYRQWYPYDHRAHRHYRPAFTPDGSIHLWIVIDD